MFGLTQRRIKLLVLLSACASVSALFHFDVWLLAGSFLMFQLYWGIGWSAGYHRYFGHSSFKTSRFWVEVMLALGLVSNFAHPGLHKITHQQHHKFSDTDKDPHLNYGYGVVAAKGYKAEPLTVAQKRWLLTDPINQRVLKYGALYPLVWTLALVLISPWAFVYLWAVPVLAIQICRPLVAVHLVHKYGYRNFSTPDNSRNSWWLGVLFGGEGLHNNHHARPEKWYFSARYYEVDPVAWFIKAIKHD